MAEKEIKIDIWGAWPLVVLIVLCLGEPDLLDALITYFQKHGECK